MNPHILILLLAIIAALMLLLRLSREEEIRDIPHYTGQNGWADGHQPMGVDLKRAQSAVLLGYYQVDGGGWYGSDGRRVYLDELIA